MNRKRIVIVATLFVAAISIGCALLWAEILMYSQNTLYLNDRWIVGKRMLEASVMGADEFLITREPLARNVLNLGSQWGCQEVIFRNPVQPTEIRFRFRIPDQSYLDLTFNRDGTKFSGLRLSRQNGSTSVLFESTREGEFLFKKQVPISIFSSGWHKAVVRFAAPNLLVEVDGADAARVGDTPPMPGRIGFRSGLQGAEVDDVGIHTADGNVIRESFSNSRKWEVAAVTNFVALVVASLGLAMLIPRRLRPGGRPVLL